MNDRQWTICVAINALQWTENDIKTIWLNGLHMPSWDGQFCSETVCAIASASENTNKFMLSNYSEGLYSKYKNSGRISPVPVPGAVVFFKIGNTSVPNHTGLIIGVTDYEIITVEGNTGSYAVRLHTYKKTDKSIFAYALPYYDDIRL